MRREKDASSTNNYLEDSPSGFGGAALTEYASIDERENSTTDYQQLQQPEAGDAITETRPSVGQISNRSKKTSAAHSPDSRRVTPQLLLDNFKDAQKAKRLRRH